MSDPNIKADPSASYQLLRNETATMLKLGDVDALGLVEGLQLDLVSLLRLEVDGLEGQVLAGQPVDLARLTSAPTMLRQLLPTQALVASPPLPETSTARFGADHRARLRQLIENVVLREDETKAAALADSMAREEAALASAALGEPPEERRPLLEHLTPAPEIVPFPSKNIATGQQPHLRSANVVPPAVSEPPPQGPIPPPKGHSEGWRKGPDLSPWRPYAYWYR